jgi:hypothetical protein
MTKFIALTGPAGVGKSTVAREIWMEAARRGVVAIKLSFATPLKEMVRTLLRQTEMSESDVTFWMNDRVAREEPCPKLMGRTVRHAMQTLGTEWGRDCIDQDFWADMMVVKALKSGADLVIFDDARFLTEKEAIERAGGGALFELHRSGISYPEGHRSEGELAGMGIRIENDDPARAARDILYITP